MHLKIKDDILKEEINGNKRSRIYNISPYEKLTEFCRCEPSWDFELSSVLSYKPPKKTMETRNFREGYDSCEESNGIDPLHVPNHAILLVGHVSKSKPTQVPMKIKRYERN